MILPAGYWLTSAGCMLLPCQALGAVRRRRFSTARMPGETSSGKQDRT